MAAITICSDFGAPKNKVSHCFPIYLPWGDGTRCHDLSFLNVELTGCLFHAHLSSAVYFLTGFDHMSIFYSALKNFNFKSCQNYTQKYCYKYYTIIDWYEVFNRRFFTHCTWFCPWIGLPLIWWLTKWVSIYWVLTVHQASGIRLSSLSCLTSHTTLFRRDWLPPLKLRKLKLREVKWLSQGHLT